MHETLVVGQANFTACSPVVCSGDLSLQLFVEMPFEIKSIESPSHKIKMKVTNSLSPCIHVVVGLYVTYFSV